MWLTGSLGVLLAYHKVIREVRSGTYRYTPNQAAFYHLIPVYGIYWVFAWTSELDRWRELSTIRFSFEPGVFSRVRV